MSRSNYNVSVCQVLESERVLKLSNILKLYHRKDYVRKDRGSFIEFISTFQIQESAIDFGCTNSCGDKMDVNHFTCVLSFEDLPPNADERQALAFIGGYATFCLIRKLTITSELCPECYSLLTEDKSIEIEDIDFNFSLIQLLDPGGLK
ncbi:hypothetical protein LOD99_15495 [Oopsacas minuta]|uniref:Uncharacterized protein n=1 Tax=Oopsacas minuta TaxID=111878 RepID=A0AAV7KD20_9METZ|nr:hypothetical protein LOD99_15495 [Oopsacas minuta]